MKKRGRLSNFEKLPAEADDILALVGDMILKNNQEQNKIYPILVQKLTEAGFNAPSFSAFNRWVTRLYEPHNRDLVAFLNPTTRGFDHPVSTRVSAEARRALQNLAKSQGRTVSAMLNAWVLERLATEIKQGAA